jgi:hypothetical protein
LLTTNRRQLVLIVDWQSTSRTWFFIYSSRHINYCTKGLINPLMVSWLVI